jgi:hypothetical protein
MEYFDVSSLDRCRESITLTFKIELENKNNILRFKEKINEKKKKNFNFS